jgi:hypothetical protein
MPKCLDCRRDLPSLETLCSKCFEARYSKFDRPKSFLESVQQYVSNPWGITPETERGMPYPWAFACGSALICWYGAFARLGYKCSLLSNAVLVGTFLVIVKSVVLSLGLSLFLARKNLKLYWEVALVLFLTISIMYARWAWHVGVFPQWLAEH